MQGYAASIRDQVWNQLRQIYDRYTGGQKSINKKQLEALTREVLREEQDAEIHYMVRNISKIDVDNSGEVDFEEFANFLLKRHCGEIALQRTHRAGRIKNGAARKMTAEEFRLLLNDAYSFLGVKVDADVARRIFAEVDTDRDSLITYQEYFKFIEAFICRTSGEPKVVAKPVEPAKPPAANLTDLENAVLVNFRRLLWIELLKIYTKYDADGNGDMDRREFSQLLAELLEETSQGSLDYVFKNAFRMDMNGDSKFIFDEFGVFFIKHTSEIGLDRFNRARGGSGNRQITLKEFSSLFRRSFGFLQSLNLSEDDVAKIFRWIDQDRDGIISYKEYLQWTLELLKFREANGTPCYFQAISSQTFIPAPAPVATVPIESKIIDKPSTRWVFSSRALADNAFQHTTRFFLTFDANGNKVADPEEIIAILKALLKENNYEIEYVLSNFFRYTRDNGPVSFEDFARFFLGLHCGELSVQRLHRERFFSRGDERLINEAEFIRALTQAFSTLKFSFNESDLKQLFRDINVNRNGWISYQHYFEALKEYFGYYLNTRIVVYIRSITTEPSVLPKPLPKPEPEPVRPIWEQLGWLIRSMTLLLLSRYDFNKNFEFEQDEIVTLLRDIFNESGTEIDYVLLNMFRYDPNGDRTVTYDELTNFILEMHCGEIALQRLHRDKKISGWERRVLSLSDFILVIRFAFAFLNYDFKQDDLTRIFQFIDTDRDGYISYSEYFTFIRNYLGSKRQITQPIEIPNIPIKRYNSIEEEVGENIRERTIKLLSKYDVNKDLQFQKSEIIELLREVFGESKIEIDYVILNVARYDSNGDGEVTYDELANFILDQHCGEITLQRLHKNKKLSRWEQRTMNLEEFSLLMRESFAFVNLELKDSDLKEIFGRLDEDRDGWIPYSRYFQFIREYMGSKRGTAGTTGATMQVTTGGRTTGGSTTQTSYSYSGTSNVGGTTSGYTTRTIGSRIG